MPPDEGARAVVKATANKLEREQGPGSERHRHEADDDDDNEVQRRQQGMLLGLTSIAVLLLVLSARAARRTRARLVELRTPRLTMAADRLMRRTLLLLQSSARSCGTYRAPLGGLPRLHHIDQCVPPWTWTTSTTSWNGNPSLVSAAACCDS